MSFRALLLRFAFASFVVGGLAACASAPPARTRSILPSARSPAADSQSELLNALPDRLARVAEFEIVRKWAAENGARVWLAGGTATGIASYVLEELLQARTGETRFPFPYQYFDIYRSTQDADLVLDADEETARRLESYLHERLGYLKGSKALWEVRLLRQSRGEGIHRKDALIDSPDFRGQNTDSYSLGLIELTAPPAGESRVRDLFDWDNHRDPRFLVDLVDGRVTYLRNPAHAATHRARSGYNPEIVSVIRAYTKSFQYEAPLRESSLTDLAAVIRGFDPEAPLSRDAIRYVGNAAQKLFLHARDVERAANELDRFGLRAKLIEFARKRELPDLARALGREPLRTYPLGTLPWIQDAYANYRPSGWTARRLKLDVVAHETSDFLAYENITMSRRGKPNLLISRPDADGEVAAYGAGAYARSGRTGARGSNLTIRFRVHPDAVEGRDFFLADRDYVVFRNAAALEVIPESASQLSLFDFLHALDQGAFAANDLGVIRKFELKAAAEVAALDPASARVLIRRVQSQMRRVAASAKLPASLTFVLQTVGRDRNLGPRILDATLEGFRAPEDAGRFAARANLSNTDLLEHFARKRREPSAFDALIAKLDAKKDEATALPEFVSALREYDRTVAPHFPDAWNAVRKYVASPRWNPQLRAYVLAALIEIAPAGVSDYLGFQRELLAWSDQATARAPLLLPYLATERQIRAGTIRLSAAEDSAFRAQAREMFELASELAFTGRGSLPALVARDALGFAALRLRDADPDSLREIFLRRLSESMGNSNLYFESAFRIWTALDEIELPTANLFLEKTGGSFDRDRTRRALEFAAASRKPLPGVLAFLGCSSGNDDWTELARKLIGAGHARSVLDAILTNAARNRFGSPEKILPELMEDLRRTAPEYARERVDRFVAEFTGTPASFGIATALLPLGEIDDRRWRILISRFDPEDRAMRPPMYDLIGTRVAQGAALAPEDLAIVLHPENPKRNDVIRTLRRDGRQLELLRGLVGREPIPKGYLAIGTITTLVEDAVTAFADPPARPPAIRNAGAERLRELARRIREDYRPSFGFESKAFAGFERRIDEALAAAGYAKSAAPQIFPVGAPGAWSGPGTREIRRCRELLRILPAGG